MNIRITLLLIFSLLYFQACTSKYILSCVFTPVPTKTNLTPELTEYKNCGQIETGGQATIAQNYFKLISFNDDGLAEIYIQDRVFYINKKGLLVRAHHFENGADYFKEGLARTIKNDKFGFINKKLNIVIEPVYDFTTPFNHGLSSVCIGCAFVKDGEHQKVTGGKWGYINKQGEVTVEIKYDKNKLASLNSQTFFLQQALKIRSSINDNNIDQLRAFSTLPLIIHNQEWTTAKDGAGFMLGKVKKTLISTEAEFKKQLRPFVKSLHIQSEQATSKDITLKMFTRELGDQADDWKRLKLFLFLRGEGDVEHIVLMGLDKTTFKLKALYIN